MQIKNYYLFQKNNSQFFYVRFTYEDGSYSSKSTKQTAEYKAQKFAIDEMNRLNEEDKKAQELKQFEKKNKLLRDYAKDFFSLSGDYVKKTKTFDAAINDRWIIEKQAIVNNHILPSPLADKYLRDIEETDIEDFIIQLKPIKIKAELSANTRNKVLMVLNTILKEAYRGKYLDRLPLTNIRFKGVKKEKDILKLEEMQRLFPDNWETIYPDRRAYVGTLVACTTGARLSEIVGLTIRCIDFNNRVIHIKQSWDKKLQRLNPTPKNKQSRKVVVCDKVLHEIKQLIAENPDPQNADSFLLYGDIPGKPFDHKYLPRHFFNALKKLNIDIEDKEVTWHSIRHSVNTHLLLSGINHLKVKRFLGHSDKSSDMQALYTHFNIDNMEDIRTFFENMLNQKSNVKRLREAM